MTIINVSKEKERARSTLSKYRPAGLMELWVIAWPLIIASLSGHVMVFVDRTFLAHHSLNSMNAAAAAGMAWWIFSFCAISIAGIAEVFVGQHNGAGRFEKVAEPVWQMILFSCATLLVFWPLAMWGGSYMMPQALYEEGVGYFTIMMLAGPLQPIFVAIAAFFTGIGRTKIITIASVLANLANLLLDYALIFGYPGLLAPLGATGAAIATATALFIQATIVFIVFLDRGNRLKYQTHKPRFVYSSMLKCIRVGYPNALGHMMEMLSWFVLFYSMANLGIEHVTILTLGQTIYILFAFLFDGIQKGVTAIAANLIGAGHSYLFNKLLYSALKMHAVIIGILCIPLVFYPDFILGLFALTQHLDVTETAIGHDGYMTCYFVWFYCVFDGFLWIVAGMLTALTDTLFIMLANSISAALIGVLPIYVLLTYYNAPAYIIWGCLDVYAMVALIALLLRYMKMMRQIPSSN
ncbi:MAG: hypothetical protein JSS50_03780 [Proteobacteria bacterium]|nr:hypothetical protein [Pseudomonadota bacterium]